MHERVNKISMKYFSRMMAVEAGTAFTHFWPMLPFYTYWDYQISFGFLVFSRGIKWESWPEMG